jgi:predicted nucleic acid-binding protein
VISFVIDASAIVELVTGTAPNRELRRAALTAYGAAPELIDLEAANTIRRLVRSGLLPAAVGRTRLRRIGDTPITRTAHRPLLGRVWELRDSVAAYDASYIALAEYLGVPLLTCDAKLGRAHGHDAEVRVYPTS